jgi:hypothetical protein
MERGFFGAAAVVSRASLVWGDDAPTALLVMRTAAVDSAPTNSTHVPTR